jgi:hypothetical protein
VREAGSCDRRVNAMTRGNEIEVASTDVLVHVADAELAAGKGDLALASRMFVESGLSAAASESFSLAVRCYRAALEIDLLDRRVIARMLGLGNRAGDGWSAYARTIDLVDWRSFGCRGASVVSGDDGATTVHCSGIGPVLGMVTTRGDRVEAYPDQRFVKMPLAMAMIILRRALWPESRIWRVADARPSLHVRVKFPAHRETRLDELGDWRSA